MQCEDAYKIEEIKSNRVSSYAFDSEEAYYHDIAISRYAITMKKGGLDCMRHYKIVVNGRHRAVFLLIIEKTPPLRSA